MASRIALFVCMLSLAALPGLALAEATALAYVQDTRGPVSPTPPATRGSTDANMFASGPGQSAFALSDQVGGVLRITGVSANAGNNTTTASASASFSERVTFSGGVGQMAYLDYSFEGSLGIANANPFQAAAFGQLQVTSANLLGGRTEYATLSAFQNTCGPGCQVGTSTDRTGTLAFLISEGPTTLTAFLSGFASFGNSFDFGNTARFYLRAPGGVTFSGQSEFLTAATPIFQGPVTPVPEPETGVLMLAGLGILASVARKRRPG